MLDAERTFSEELRRTLGQDIHMVLVLPGGRSQRARPPDLGDGLGGDSGLSSRAAAFVHTVVRTCE
jgi:hypothetical protein